jgi:hypothetical protein
MCGSAVLGGCILYMVLQAQLSAARMVRLTRGRVHYAAAAPWLCNVAAAILQLQEVPHLIPIQ